MAADRKRGLVVVNPAARGTSETLVRDVVARCESRLDLLPLVSSDHRAMAVETVARAVAAGRLGGEPVTRVIAVGGDATVAAVAEGIARGGDRWTRGNADEEEILLDGEALAVVPAGNGNSIYRAFWGDDDWRATLGIALDGERAAVARLDLVRIVELDRGVLLGAGTGLLADISRLTQAPSDETGRERYWTAIATALGARRAYDGRVVVDGTELHRGPTTLVAVGGVSRLGGGDFELLPRSSLDDGLLDVLAVDDLDERSLAELSVLLPAGAHLGRDGVAYAQGRTAVIECTEGSPLRLALDGDLIEEVGSRVTLEMLPNVLPAVCHAP